MLISKLQVGYHKNPYLRLRHLLEITTTTERGKNEKKYKILMIWKKLIFTGKFRGTE